ncbi:hypothetical protein JCM3766R1_003217 [Sporobolomyces carnicolor]
MARPKASSSSKTASTSTKKKDKKSTAPVATSSKSKPQPKPKAKPLAAKKKKRPVESSSDEEEANPSSESDSDARPPPKKKSKSTTKTTTGSDKKKPNKPTAASTTSKGKGKAKETIVLSSDDDEEPSMRDSSDVEVEKPSKAATSSKKSKQSSSATAKAKAKATTTTGSKAKAKSKTEAQPKQRLMRDTSSSAENFDKVAKGTGRIENDEDDESSNDLIMPDRDKLFKEAMLNATSAKSKSNAKAKAKAKANANSPPTPLEHGAASVASTSTSAATKSVSSKSKKPAAKPKTFEEDLKDWFIRFVDREEGGEEGEGGGSTRDLSAIADKDLTMGGEGIEKLFEEMNISMDGVHPFLLAFDVAAAPGTFGSFSYVDFERAFKAHDIRTSSALAKHLESLKESLYSASSSSGPVRPPVYSESSGDDEYQSIRSTTKKNNAFPTAEDERFHSFYRFLFAFLKPEGQKSLPKEFAIPALEIVFSTAVAAKEDDEGDEEKSGENKVGEKWKLGREFVEFAKDQGEAFKSVSQDVWNQLFEFLKTVGPDLEGWSEMDAWPSTIDRFVEWKQAKDAAAAEN